MKFLEKYFGKAAEDPFDRAPFLFPWYVAGEKPELIRNKKTLSWHYVEEIDGEYVGLTELCCGAEVLGLFTIYTYIFASRERDSFCVWNRSANNRKSSDYLNIDVFRSNDLAVFEDVDESASRFHKLPNTSYLLNCKPHCSFFIPLNSKELQAQMKLPIELSWFDDFIAVIGMGKPDSKEMTFCDTTRVETRN